MADRLRAILGRILDWWKKFSARQKAVIISAAAVVAVALGILVFVVTRPTMINIYTATTYEQASKVKDLLDGEGISYQVSPDSLSYSINKKDEAQVRLLLGSNDIPTSGYTIDDVLSGSFATTEADKQKRYKVLMEENFKNAIESIKAVRSATVILNIPNDDGTLIANQLDSYATITLDLRDPLDVDQASGIAKFVATGLGNDTTRNITILDTNGNVVFAGGDEATSAGIASSNQKVLQQAESLAAQKVKRVLAGSGAGSIFNNVEIGINLDMSFDKVSSSDYRYYVEEGQTQGYLDSRSESKTESQNGVMGVPGTDANDDTTYVLQDNQTSKSSSSDIVEDYLPSETITQRESQVGVVNYGNSTISVVAYNNVIYNEDQLKANGTLDGITFEQFIEENRNQERVEVDEAIFQAVSNATGIPVENISILAYDVPMFQYSVGGRDWTDWLQIALAVLIIAMLGFVVFRTLRSEEEEAVEAEVTVDELMAAGEESDLEAVRFSEKSEARLMIEKFVDERPEAVASLLRNWLNEEWGE